MNASDPTRARKIRESLPHPVIDADGHILEFMPAALPYLRESLRPSLFEQYRQMRKPIEAAVSNPISPSQRQASRKPQAGWWGSPVASTRDVASSLFPKLLHERTGELGIDFLVLYPTNALGSAGIENGELRRGLCSGINAFLADAYRPYADRLAPAGMIPMHTPEEAIAELEHCKALGLKVAGIPQGVLREIPAPDRENPSPWLWPNQTHWWDHFGLESAHDYDPVWAKFEELGYALTCHGGIGPPPTGHYTSTTNWMYNHIGSFAAMMYPICKSLYFDGVAKRFPKLPIAFLECGVSWACTLLADTVEHYEKRNLAALAEHFAPEKTDLPALAALAREYAPELVESLGGDLEEAIAGVLLRGIPPDELDDFPEFKSPEDLKTPFAENFYFGCESDDRTVAFAYSDANAFGIHLNPMLSSDISHFDVPVMTDVLPDAYTLVERGTLTERQFREFAFENAARLFTATDPDFFSNTALATQTGAP